MTELKNLNLICGNETFLMEQKKDELLCQLHAEQSPSFNAFSGKDTDLSEVLRLAQTAPLLEERRVIYLSDTGYFKGHTDEELLSGLSELPETTVIIFLETAVDKTSGLYKLFKKSGDIFLYENADKKDYRTAEKLRSDIKSWALERLKAEGLSIGQRELELLLELCGYDMMNLSNELEKLICFKLSDDRRSISRDDIELICSRTVSDRVFDMISAKLSGNVSRALRLCEEMLSIKIPAGRILYMLERQFNSLYIMKDMSSLGIPDQEIMKAASLTDWQLRRLRKEARSISRDRAYDYLRLSVELETRIKQGDMPERIALELLLSS